MSVRDLQVYRMAEELLYKLYPRLINYPKSEKFSLAQTIKNHLFDLLTNISLGNSVKSKRVVHLQQADAHLQTLKVLIRLSKQRRYISVGFHDNIQVELTEINKLLSGYIRSANKK